MSSFNYVVAVRKIAMHHTTKLVAITLATYADYRTGECYPTIQQLMEDTGLSNRVVCEHVKQLEKHSFFTVDRSNGRRSYYKFNAEILAKAVTESHQLPSVTSDFDDIQPVTFMQEAVTLAQKAVTESHTNYHKQLLTTNKQPDIKREDVLEGGDLKTEPKPKKPKFEKPSLDVLKLFFEENGSSGHESFFDYFESNGWKIGGKSPMVDWKAAARNWMRNEKKFGGSLVTQKPAYQTAADRTAQEQKRWKDALNAHSTLRDVSPKKANWIEGVGHA